MASVTALAKAAILSQLIKSVTGTEPAIVDRGATVSIEFSEPQKKIFREKLLSILEAKPGEIKMDLVGLAGPVLIKKLWYLIAAPLGLGFLAGFFVGKSGQ
jgi:hypothetical protein